MKFDMGGSAATLGAAKAIGQIKPPGVEASFLMHWCQNFVKDSFCLENQNLLLFLGIGSD